MSLIWTKPSDYARMMQMLSSSIRPSIYLYITTPNKTLISRRIDMSSVSRISPQDDVRAHITASLCAQRAPDGTPEETLITFLKVYEEDPAGGTKSRYLILAGKAASHE